MARKVRGFERVLDAPALFAIAYGEIASSIYVALGIVTASALGLTPLVLAFTGLVFGLISRESDRRHSRTALDRATNPLFDRDPEHPERERAGR